MAIFVSDSFTEASDVGLGSHTGEQGASWTAHPHVNYAVAMTVDSATDRIYQTNTTAFYASAQPPSADYYVLAPFFVASVISVNIAIVVRMHETDDTMYFARLNNGTVWEIVKRVTGTAQTIGSSTNQLPTVGNAKTGKLIVQGDQLSFYVDDVLEIGPITDAVITAAGRAGVRGAGLASSSTGFHLSSFEAGTLGSDTIPYFGSGHSPYQRIMRVSNY